MFTNADFVNSLKMLFLFHFYALVSSYSENISLSNSVRVCPFLILILQILTNLTNLISAARIGTSLFVLTVHD